VVHDVRVVDPITINASVDQKGQYGGLGMTTTMVVTHNCSPFGTDARRSSGRQP